ncbi:spore protease YyaC [Thermohalobacter berrensis]|uniref:Spore protease YyaC n=1 Tax=Thermohalobacter berrensis TaxID=99594 RepID=A0A419T4K5_9FIRM|nr:spore protease YyaC [Thermohalobacter berrensis]
MQKEVYYNDRFASETLGRHLKPYLKNDMIIICVGTDKCIGDCLGPLVGTLLKKSNFPYPVYGTLGSPIHALNLKEKLINIKQRHPFNFAIAIDACLGEEENIGIIQVRQSPIFPGKGVGKNLPSIGDISIIGIVDSLKSDNNISLHNIRLGFVMEMAETITRALIKAAKY